MSCKLRYTLMICSATQHACLIYRGFYRSRNERKGTRSERARAQNLSWSKQASERPLRSSASKLRPLHPLPSHATIFPFSVSLAPTRCPILNGLRRAILSTPRWFPEGLRTSALPLTELHYRLSPPKGNSSNLEIFLLFTRLPFTRSTIPCKDPPTCSCRGEALRKLEAPCSMGAIKARKM